MSTLNKTINTDGNNIPVTKGVPIPQGVPISSEPIPSAPPLNEETTNKNDSTGKKEEKIPNSLIVYIKTRIPNFYKVNYEPFMTVPKNKSHTVYFEPLVKYYEGPVKNIPTGAPKDALYTQFFEAAEFDTMINRILSDFRYMQKPRDLQQAYDEHIIDNNINITLKTLFKSNNLFYINNKPYTIVGSHWNNNDWQIDKKPIEKLLNQFSHLTASQLEAEAKQEEDDIPEVLRQGSIASSNLNSDEVVTSVASGLQNVVDSAKNVMNDKEISGKTDAFVSADKLPGVSEDMRRLYSEYLRQNIPINYSDSPDLARDPLTISLLIDPSELLIFINKNKKSNIIDLYSAYISSKTNLQKSDKEYTDACTAIAIYKTEFDKKVSSIISRIKRIDRISTETQKEEKNKIIQEITLLKINYMKLLFRIADAIMEIYTQQKLYFVSSKVLLEGLQSEYVNIIKYYEEPELAIKCIEYDINTISALIELDPENPYSQSYFSNFEKFKSFYEKVLYKNEKTLLTPQVNYRDEEYYINNPNTLLIEKQQYEVYNFKMFLYYSYNQFDIWVMLFKSIQIFSKFIGNETIQIIKLSEKEIDKYNNTFPKNDFIDRIQADGIKASYDSSTKKFDWYLVKEDGTRCIPPFTKEKKPLNYTEDENQERLYISSMKAQVNAYDAIILYIYLLEIVCLRQNRVYVAEENVNQLNLEFSLTLNEYYYTIENSIKDGQQTGLETYIPESLLWDTKSLNDTTFLNNKKKINDKSSLVYRGRIQAIQKSRQDIVNHCEEIADIITPTISQNGFITKCQALLISNFGDIYNHSFRSSYWLEKTIENYDNEATSDFIYNINSVVKDAWYDRIIQEREPEDHLDWMVYNNAATNTTESIYATISDLLNAELDLNGDETDNQYTEEIDGKKRFTVSSLKQLVTSENPNPTTDSDIISILQEVLKIKFIVFEMFPRDDNSIRLGDIVNYKNHKYRVLQFQEANNSSSAEEARGYNLYNGYEILKDIPAAEVTLSNKNITNLFRVECNYIDKNIDTMDHIYLLLSPQKQEEGKSFLKYKYVKNSSKNNFIYVFDEIPVYIQYFIFNNCARFKTDIQTGFGVMDPAFKNFIRIIQTQLNNNALETELANIKNELKNKSNEYKKLEKIKDKTSEQRTQKTLLKGDLSDLKARRKELQLLLDDKQTTGLDNLLGGATTLRPSDQYINYSAPGYNVPDYNVPGPGYNVSGPGYYGQQMNPYMQNNQMYLPSRSPYSYPYYNQRRLPYNVSQNKAKDSKSKLSFYITIELELFPGTTANAFQKSVVKCQSTFERIREAWSDIFGYQYRPAPMSEAYAYGIQKNNNKNNNNNNNNKNKNTSEKNKQYVYISNLPYFLGLFLFLALDL